MGKGSGAFRILRFDLHAAAMGADMKCALTQPQINVHFYCLYREALSHHLF